MLCIAAGVGASLQLRLGGKTVGETVMLLHPPLPSPSVGVGVCQQSDYSRRWAR